MSRPLAILKFDSAMSRSSIGNLPTPKSEPYFAFDSRAAAMQLNPGVRFTPEQRTLELSRVMSALFAIL
jgi:hypothetical protein